MVFENFNFKQALRKDKYKERKTYTRYSPGAPIGASFLLHCAYFESHFRIENQCVARLLPAADRTFVNSVVSISVQS